MSQSSPVLFEDYDICGFLKSEAPHLRVSIEDLKNPKMEIICEIYRWFVIQLTQCKESAVDDIQPDLAHLLEEPTFFETSTAITQLALSLDFILVEIGTGEQITCQDLLFPTNKKTVLIISQLMRFYMFVRQRSTFIESCMESMREAAEEKRALKQQNDDLKQRILMIRAGMPERESGLNQLKERKMHLFQKCKANIESRKKAEENAKTVNDKLNSTQKLLNEKLREKNMLAERNAHLLNQIVHSPDRLVAEVGELKSRKGEYEQKIAALSSQVFHLTNKLAELPKTERFFDLLLESIESVTEEVQKQDVLTNNKESLVEQIHKSRTSMNEISRQIQEKRGTVTNRSEKLTKLVQQQNRRLQDVEQEIEEVQQKLADLEKETGENEVVAMDFDEQCKKIRHDINQMINERENQLNICKEIREKLFKALDWMDAQVTKYYKQFDDGNEDA